MNQYIGRLLDNRYEILEVIGTGGMAVVYKALCHRLNRLVAIKILKDEYSGDEEFRRRFRAEGEAVAMLSNPNIVQVFDVSSSDTANYIVMELIDGISLKQYMEAKGVLNWKETLHFAMQIATGLEHAHSRGIVHRDIKPHNVMVLKNGSVKVMDFGIARVMSKSNTLTKEALGSVHYISPEQAKGGLTDNRSDLYSLGVVMYEMMTGRPPYDGESPVSVAIQHINGGAVPPSSLNPNIPKGMEQIILKAMALEMKDRFDSATAMLQDMEEFRKNPAIVFPYALPQQGETRVLPVVTKKMTTAQKVAGEKGSTGRVPNTHPQNYVHANGSVVDDKTRIQRLPGKPQQPERNTDAIRRAQLRRAEEKRRAEKRRSMTTVAVCACSFVAVIAIVVFLVAVFNGALLKKENELVDVPNLVGEYYSEATAAMYKEFNILLRPQEYSDEYAKGQIIEQQPLGNMKVYAGTDLYLTVSLGEEPQVKIMEQLSGVAEEEAKSFLIGQGFYPLVREEPSMIYPAGTVTRTDPSMGNELTEGQTINIWVSTGPEVITNQMPDLLGMDKETALRVLDQLGFSHVSTESVDSEKAKGIVVRQSHERRTDVDVEETIVLYISKGPAAPKPTNPPATTAPAAPTETTAPSSGSGSPGSVVFPLPSRSEEYVLTIYQGGVQILSDTVIKPGQTGIEMRLTGTGAQEFDLYINGEFYQKQKVSFQ